MTRYSVKSGEVAAKKGASKKFEVEAGKLPAKPRTGVDGLYSDRSRPKEMVAEDQHLPQVLGETKGGKSLRGKDYDNDTQGWSRGGDAGGSGRPGFDNGKYDIGNKPPKAPTGNNASGSDCHTSPFSRASKVF